MQRLYMSIYIYVFQLYIYILYVYFIVTNFSLVPARNSEDCLRDEDLPNGIKHFQYGRLGKGSKNIYIYIYLVKMFLLRHMGYNVKSGTLCVLKHI